MTSSESSASKSALWSRDRKIYLGLFLGMATMVLLLAFVLEDTAEKARAHEREVLIQGLRFQLAIPEEVLFYDEKAVREVTEIRTESMKQLGVDTFCPYYQLLHPHERLLFADGQPVDRIDVDNGDSMFHESLEHSWIRESFRACTILAAEIQIGEGLGLFLRENPDVFDYRIRPYMERLLGCRHPWPRRGAAMVLLAMGDRSDRLKGILEQLLTEKRWLHEHDHDHVKELQARYFGIQPDEEAGPR